MNKQIPIIGGFNSYVDLKSYADLYSGRDKILIQEAITVTLKTVTNIEKGETE